jgi:dTDP-glucose 4,6-dehydratase
MELAHERRAAIVYVSASDVYGDPLGHSPPAENLGLAGGGPCYAASKRFGEALVTVMRRTHGLRANIVRTFDAYGPRMRGDVGRVIPAFIASALAGQDLQVPASGSQTASVCYVSDVVDGLLHVALDPALDGAIFDIGDPREITLAHLASAVRAIVAGDASIAHVAQRPGVGVLRRPDIRRMEEHFRWKPRVPLAEGLRRTVEWFAATAPATRSDAREDGAQEIRLKRAPSADADPADDALRFARPDRGGPVRPVSRKGC